MPTPSSIAAGCGGSSPSGACCRLAGHRRRGRHRRGMRARHRRLRRYGLHRARDHQRPDPHRPPARRGAGAARKSTGASAVIVHINSPGGTTAGLRGTAQLVDAAARRRSRWWSSSTGSRLRAAISRRWAPITSWRRDLAGRLDRRDVPVSEFHRLLKTLGIKVEEIKSSPLKAAPIGLRAHQPGGPRRDRVDRDGLLRLVQGLVQSAATSTTRRSRRWRTAASSPAGRRWRSSSSTSSATRGRLSPGWPRRTKIDPKTPVRDFRLSDRFSDLPSCILRRSAARCRWIGRACAALRGTGARSGHRATQP